MDEIDKKRLLEPEEFEIIKVEEVTDEKVSNSKKIGNMILFCAKKAYYLTMVGTSVASIQRYFPEVEIMKQNGDWLLTIANINLGLFSLFCSAKLVKCLHTINKTRSPYSIFPAIIATSGVGILMSAVNPGYDVSGFYGHYTLYSFFVGLVLSGAMWNDNSEISWNDDSEISKKKELKKQ